ncbi:MULTISPECIES: sterol desaturase family protein [unclassified Mesorhizobium]|uniref:sterol desaturase family protein n=3 Tax=Mesorhizobium TaxID=68287 RepID=UPI001FDFF299|nr:MULTISPECIES: sterol desaturase family protein [unclassified Mesorhizobium]
MDAIQQIADLFGLKAVAIGLLIFIPLERLFPLRRLQRIFRKGFFNDLSYAAFNGFVVNFVGGLIFVPIFSALALLVPDRVTTGVAGQQTWMQVLEIIVLTDLGVYAAHRTFHAVPILWRFHAIHHSVEEMDCLAAFHVHPVDQIVTKATALLPVFLLGFSGEAIALYSVIYMGHTMLVHSNTKIGFGPLTWLIAGPQFHHWHHAGERAAYDRNFAGQLALIDLVFGTYRVPTASMPAKYGVDDPIPSNIFGQIGYPLVPRKAVTTGDRPRSEP